MQLVPLLALGAWLWPTVLALSDNSSTLWGTYRPQLYFGMRPREPDSLLTGLAWFSTADFAYANSMRHSASDNNGIDYFKWTYHDGRHFGEQDIVDRLHNYKITTSFVKSGHLEGQPGHWALRVQGTVLDESRPAELTSFFYVGSESRSESLEVDSEGRVAGPHLGGFSLRTEEPATNQAVKNVPITSFSARTINPSHVWRGSDHIVEDLRLRLQAFMEAKQQLPRPAEAVQLSNRTDAHPTMYVLQKTYQGNFSYDVFFDSHVSPATDKLHSDTLTLALMRHKEAYDARFEHLFGLSSSFTPKHVTFARELTAQILGSIGYYFGESLVDRRPADEEGLVLHDMDNAQPLPEGPMQLWTATPSRSFFPRGFYWDEGFHLLHISAWDPTLAMSLFESWTQLIDDDGWVAREQILGEEARSRVPGPFQTQYPLYANPPTLIFGLQTFLENMEEHLQRIQDQMGGVDVWMTSTDAEMDQDEAKVLQKHLQALYEPWQRHYAWFRRTQRGQIRQWDRDATSRHEAYRWRGRSATHVLTSGLDDYPRASVPHVGELHVDLHSWMGSFAHAMKRWARLIGWDDDAEEYDDQASSIEANLVDLHWNPDEHMFCDLSVDESDSSYFECHAGYVSLFPMMLQLLPPDSEQLGSTLRMLRDKKALWSDYGIRSLSMSHPLYGTDEDYWRGAIWVPVNYLILRSLHMYQQQPGPYAAEAATLYKDLRSNIISTVLNVCTQTTNQ
ncbi:Processing alpha glucosidase I [Malassezia pachydermatis]